MELDIQITTTGGADLTIAAMDEHSRSNIGRTTYNMVRRVMRNPEYRKLIDKMVAELETTATSA